MNTTPRKYRKRPVEIEAMHYDGTPVTCLPIHAWIGIEHGGTDAECDAGIYIDTLEGQMRVGVGDYVIRGVQGEFYPCKPDIFEATYEDASAVQRPTDAEAQLQAVRKLLTDADRHHNAFIETWDLRDALDGTALAEATDPR